MKFDNLFRNFMEMMEQNNYATTYLRISLLLECASSWTPI